MPDSTQTHEKRWWALGVLAIPTLLLSMDQSILYLALPELSKELGASSNESLWIMDIYGFFLAGFLITMGSLGDRIGRRRLLMIGAATFTVATTLAAFSPSAEYLIVTRALMGVAGATLMPSTLALISNIFTDAKERGAAIAAWFSCLMVGGALGPIVSGALLSQFWWGSVFLIGVPIMLLLLLLGPILLPEYRNPAAGRIDLISVPLSLAAILPVIYGIKELAAGHAGVVPWLAIVAGIVIGVAFVHRQSTLKDPMVNLRLFRSRRLSTSLVILLFGAMTFGGMYLIVSLYMQAVEGFSPLVAALWLLPSTVAIIVGSMLTPALVGTIKPSHLIAGGLLVTTAGYLLMTQLPSQGGLLILVLAFVLAFLGAGPMGALGTDLVVSQAPAEQAGSAASLSESANHLGIAVGIAGFGSIASAVYSRQMEMVAIPAAVPGGEAMRESVINAAAMAGDVPPGIPGQFSTELTAAFVSGLHATAWVGAALFFVLAIAAAVLLKDVTAPQPHVGGEPSGEVPLSPEHSAQGALTGSDDSAREPD